MKKEPGRITLYIWTVLLLLMSSFTTSEVVFTEVPGPGPVTVPVGGHIIFNCSVSPEDMIIGWRVYVPDVRLEYFTDSTSNRDSLALLGITVRKDGSLSSQLIINATRENLLTYALCEARTGTDDTTLTQSEVDIKVYGPPKSPTNVTFGVKDDLLTVSWYCYIIPNVSLTFDLILTNLRTSNIKEVTIYDTQQCQFTVKDVEACNELEVLVKARNNAGVSKYVNITGNLPVLPDVNTLQYVLSNNNRASVTLIITFMIPMPCPVTTYTLEVILENSGQDMREQSTTSSSGPAVSLKVEGLLENATYTYSIIAVNSIGRASTISTSFLTTDVQGVRVCLVGGSTYSIQCSYIAGINNTRGCSYALVGVEEGARAINGTIDGSTTVKEDIPNIFDNSRILVYDEDNVLVMNKTLDSEKIGSCTTTATEIITAVTTATNSSREYLVHVIGFVLCVAFVILVASVGITVCMTVHGCSCTKNKVEEGTPIVLTKRLYNVNDCESQKEPHQEVTNCEVTRAAQVQLTN